MDLKTQQYLEVSQSVNLLGQKKQEMLQYIQQYKTHYEKQVKHVKQMQKYTEQLQNTQQQLKIKIQSKQEQLQEMDTQISVKIEQKQLELEQFKSLQQQNKTTFKKQQYKLQEDAHLVEQFIEQQTDKLKQLEFDKENLSKRLNEQINSLNAEKIVLKNLLENQQNDLSIVQQSLFDLEQLEAVDEQFVQTLQSQIDNLDQQINQISDNIIQLKQQSSNLKINISQLQDQENQKKIEINRQIKILQDQKKTFQDQFKDIEEQQQNQIKIQDQSYLQLSNEHFSKQKLLTDLNTQLNLVNDQEKILYNQIGQANQNLFDQREKINIQLQQFQKKENSVSDLLLDEKKTIQIQQEKLQARYQEFTQSYEQHCKEMIDLKNSYESTINNLKRKISDSNQQLQQYELQLKQNDESEQEFKPQYYVINKGKGKYIPKPKPNAKVEEEEVQESASESDDEHHTIIVKFQTKNKIKSSKKKIIIELENGTYYLTYNGYIQKTKKDENILIDCRKSAKKNYNFSYKVKLFDEIDQLSNSKWIVKNNKVHKLKIGAISGSRVFLKVKLQSMQNQHSAVGINQLYYGFYVQDDIKYPMFFKDLEVDKSGAIQGTGKDQNGKFDIQGNLNLQTNQFQFQKQYLDYGVNYIDSFKGISVNYLGSYLEDTFKGTWNLQDGEGDFEIKKSFKIYNYKGFFLSNGAKTEMEFSLSKVSKNQVEGIGMDEVGEFTIAGTVADDGTATLTKSYRSHSVNYLGMIQGTKLRGIWTLSDVTGEFEVQDIQY